MVYFNGPADFDGKRASICRWYKMFLGLDYSSRKTAAGLFFCIFIRFCALLKNNDLILCTPIAMCTLHSAFLLTTTTFAIFRPNFVVFRRLSSSLVVFWVIERTPIIC